MKFLIDMNLPPKWVDVFEKSGLHAIHWSKVGKDSAKDSDIMQWARDNDCIIITHDLDFGQLLALTGAMGPSVIQIRTQNILPSKNARILLTAISQFHDELVAGAIVSFDLRRKSARVLPIASKKSKS